MWEKRHGRDHIATLALLRGRVGVKSEETKMPMVAMQADGSDPEGRAGCESELDDAHRVERRAIPGDRESLLRSWKNELIWRRQR